MIKSIASTASLATDAGSPEDRHSYLPLRSENFLSRVVGKLAEIDQLEVAYAMFLGEFINFIAARGAVVRIRDDDGQWRTAAQSAFPDISLGAETAATRHGRLVFETFVTGRPKLIPPGAQIAADQEANPTTDVLAVAPLVVGDRHRGVVELLLPVESSEADQARGILAVKELGEAIAEWERRLQLRREIRLTCAEELDRFTHAAYEKLDATHTAYAVANDGRRITGGDRLTVLVRRRGKYRIAAMSGLDVVETRSAAAKQLCQVAAVVGETGELATYPSEADRLTPQVREALGLYVDEAHVRSIYVVPLKNPNKSPGREPTVIGCLVCEQIDDAAEMPGRRELLEVVAAHAARALVNSLSVDRIPLRSVWQWRDRLSDPFAPAARRRTLAIVGLAALALAALVFVPADFTVHAPGTLRPSLQRAAFAPLDGTIREVLVRHGDVVELGQPLVRIVNVDLQVTLADVAGKRTAAREQLLSTERSLFESNASLTVADRHRLSGRRSELKQEIASLEEQLALLRKKQEQLVVRSPIAGEVLTWNLEELLANRPVRAGQQIVEIGSVSGSWDLEMKLPEDDVGHVSQARQTTTERLPVRFRLATVPDKDFTAEVCEMHLSAEVRGDDGNTVLVRAALNASDLPPLRHGAAASAKIHCGRRSVGYVWLHDVVDFLRCKVFFRLS